jgi:hypothetical protein
MNLEGGAGNLSLSAQSGIFVGPDFKVVGANQPGAAGLVAAVERDKLMQLSEEILRTG